MGRERSFADAIPDELPTPHSQCHPIRRLRNSTVEHQGLLALASESRFLALFRISQVEQVIRFDVREAVDSLYVR